MIAASGAGLERATAPTAAPGCTAAASAGWLGLSMRPAQNTPSGGLDTLAVPGEVRTIGAHLLRAWPRATTRLCWGGGVHLCSTTCSFFLQDHTSRFASTPGGEASCRAGCGGRTIWRPPGLSTAAGARGAGAAAAALASNRRSRCATRCCRSTAGGGSERRGDAAKNGGDVRPLLPYRVAQESRRGFGGIGRAWRWRRRAEAAPTGSHAHRRRWATPRRWVGVLFASSYFCRGMAGFRKRSEPLTDKLSLPDEVSGSGAH